MNDDEEVDLRHLSFLERKAFWAKNNWEDAKKIMEEEILPAVNDGRKIDPNRQADLAGRLTTMLKQLVFLCEDLSEEPPVAQGVVDRWVAGLVEEHGLNPSLLDGPRRKFLFKLTSYESCVLNGEVTIEVPAAFIEKFPERDDIDFEDALQEHLKENDTELDLDMENDHGDVDDTDTELTELT
jgi:hypothetical protein